MSKIPKQHYCPLTAEVCYRPLGFEKMSIVTRLSQKHVIYTWENWRKTVLFCYIRVLQNNEYLIYYTISIEWIQINMLCAFEPCYFELTSIQIRWPVTIYCWLLLHERFVSIRNIYSKCHIWPCIKFAHLQNVVSVTTQKSLSLVCKYIRYLRKSLRIHDLEMWWNLLLRETKNT